MRTNSKKNVLKKCRIRCTVHYVVWDQHWKQQDTLRYGLLWMVHRWWILFSRYLFPWYVEKVNSSDAEKRIPVTLKCKYNLESSLSCFFYLWKSHCFFFYFYQSQVTIASSSFFSHHDSCIFSSITSNICTKSFSSG